MTWKADGSSMDALAGGVTTSQGLLDEVVARIRSAGRPSRIILFGSRARGDADEDSDLDLLVVEPALDEQDRGERMVRYRAAIGRIGLGVDLLVLSEEELAHRGRVRGTTLYHALTEGRTLYGPG
jgi:uncharacterized protein